METPMKTAGHSPARRAALDNFPRPAVAAARLSRGEIVCGARLHTGLGAAQAGVIALTAKRVGEGAR